MSSNRIAKNDMLFLYYDDRRSWLVEAVEGNKFHTHKGIVDLAAIIGMEYGSRVTSSLGEEFVLLHPTTFDFIMNSYRPTQIMYPKDIGLVCVKLGLTSGKTVLEAGTGSGAMTVAAAMAVQPNGHVFTYEVKKDFAQTAKRNLKRAGVLDYVTVKLRDARDGFDETEADAAIIDLGDPWELVKPAHSALKGGSPLVSFSPTMNQTERMVETLRSASFVNIQTYETLLRPIRAQAGKSRPVTTMIAHTGYLTFANKAAK
jgi:tRNA (adenine57-N1/adenine58-N1)-methyltransferase